MYMECGGWRRARLPAGADLDLWVRALRCVMVVVVVVAAAAAAAAPVVVVDEAMVEEDEEEDVVVVEGQAGADLHQESCTIRRLVI